ncbi:MAG: hypothetical protein IM631_21590 [Cytophagales bacterium]|jgi:hypothetical protein|nr:hypothetical protein [Cytophagales bacterium]MCA6373957.1 hypothetical protein [Cytophagales bacterium]MCA6376446.1 hypothetical protein [Cytophagales bacterium]MCA6383866.1 hypothetical protein [Cytophagales bacterium]
MSRICNCQKPPGGGIECPSDSLAICRKENGECKGYCRRAPSGLDAVELFNWVLRIVKEDNRSLSATLSNEDQQILSTKQFVKTYFDGRQVVVGFDFPDTDEISGSEKLGVVEV